MSIESCLKNLYFISGFVICTVKYTHTCALGTGFKLVSCKWGPKGKQNYVSIWGRSLGFYIGQCPMIQNYWPSANECGSFSEEKNLTMLLFWGGKHVYASLLGSAQCSKNVGDGPINVAPSQREKEKLQGCTPPLLINNSTTNKYPPFHVPDRMNIQDKTKYSPIG
jgi:hypothetical protein